MISTKIKNLSVANDVLIIHICKIASIPEYGTCAKRISVVFFNINTNTILFRKTDDFIYRIRKWLTSTNKETFSDWILKMS